VPPHPPEKLSGTEGGSGNDRIVATEGNKDIIDCGTGTDTVFYDVGLDTIKGCENKNP
jgi:hypothetical protein